MFYCHCIKDIEEYDVHEGDELYYHFDNEETAYAVYFPMTKEPIDYFTEKEFHKYFKA